MTEVPPALIAAFDQRVAEYSTALAELIETHRGNVAAVGQCASVAHLAAVVSEMAEDDSFVIGGFLAVAIDKLAKQ